MKTQTLRVLVSKEGDMYVAQCLEHDVAVQAPDMETLQRRFESTMAMEDDLASLEPAPEAFHKIWEAAFGLDSPFPNAEARLAA